MAIRRLVLMVPGLLVPLAILIGVKVYLAFAADPSYTLLIDNPASEAVTVTVDGEAVGTVSPGQALTVEVEPGTHQLVATGPSGVIEQGSFAFTEGGDYSRLCGVYNLGGSAQYADVTVYYADDPSSSQPPTISPAGQGQRFFLTSSAHCELDRRFEDVVTTSSAASITSVTHICHVGQDGMPTCPNI
jgi:hypothetical protein